MILLSNGTLMMSVIFIAKLALPTMLTLYSIVFIAAYV